jgi:parallel beta helix pectate lyase-like protein
MAGLGHANYRGYRAGGHFNRVEGYMSIRFMIAAIAVATLFLLTCATPGYAQATRTWVSGVGDDANPCSRTAPCKTFAGAISKTAANGEISVLDPGGFGAVTITKSISIVADGSEGSILACLTSGININGAGINVHLRGLLIEGCGNGFNGIRVLAAGSVHIEKCMIRGFLGNSSSTNGAIEIIPSNTAPKVVISDCTISNNNRGIVAAPSATGSTTVVVNRVVAFRNLGPTIRPIGAAATLWLNDSVITGNATGLAPASGGVLHSLGNNVVENNTANGSPTDTISLK